MTILYPLLCYFPSQAGGPANSIYWLNKSLGKYENKSIVISTRYGLKDVNSAPLDLYKKFNIDAYFVKGNISYFKWKYFNKIFSSEIIHFSSLFFFPTIFYMMIGLFYSKKIVISPRGELYGSAISRKSTGKKLYLKIISLFQRKINFHATNVYEGSLIKLYFPNAKEILILPNYIEIPVKRYVPKIKQILFLGRINSIKNIDLLINAYHQLPLFLKDEFKLIIAGEAKLDYEKEHLSELQKLVSKLNLTDNIVFIGGIFGEAKEVLLSESYCTILPSKSENFGNVILESLCQGTPVIVSKNAPWELVEKNEAGFWTKPCKIAIKDALVKILTLNEYEYITLQDNALSLALSHFDIEKNVHKWQQFYKNLN